MSIFSTSPNAALVTLTNHFASTEITSDAGNISLKVAPDTFEFWAKLGKSIDVYIGNAPSQSVLIELSALLQVNCVNWHMPDRFPGYTIAKKLPRSEPLFNLLKTGFVDINEHRLRLFIANPDPRSSAQGSVLPSLAIPTLFSHSQDSIVFLQVLLNQMDNQDLQPPPGL